MLVTVVAILLLLLVVVAALLFGEAEACARTPLSFLNWALLEGLCDGIEWAARRMCGIWCLSRAEALCCDRRNPLVPALFLGLLGGATWACWHVFFPLLPLPGIPAWHKYTGTAAAALCLALFAATMFSDPGTVTPANYAAHAALYPPDGLLLFELAGKECWTCCLPRPARSKHCSSCGRCVARHDHHCIWIANCVGLLNTRLFLAFLLVTTATCYYGAALGAATLRGELNRIDAWHFAYLVEAPSRPAPAGSTARTAQQQQQQRVAYLGDSWSALAQFVVVRYGPQAALTFFLGATGWIVLGFTAYTLYHICCGMTTSEAFKRRGLRQQLLKQQQAEQLVTGTPQQQRTEQHSAQLQQQQSAHGEAGSSTQRPVQQPGPARTEAQPQAHQQQKEQQQPAASLPCHAYDRGWRCNLSEVLFPHWHLRQAAAAAAAAGNAGELEGVPLKKQL